MTPEKKRMARQDEFAINIAFSAWYIKLMRRAIKLGIGEMVQDKESWRDAFDDGYDVDEALHENMRDAL